jgi:hypothetical protein
MPRLARGIGSLPSHESYTALRDILQDRNSNAIVRATAMDAVAMMFVEHRGLNLAELAQNANFLVFPGWLWRIARLHL